MYTNYKIFRGLGGKGSEKVENLQIILTGLYTKLKQYNNAILIE